MINKINGFQNGYILTRTSTDEELQEIFKQYRDKGKLNCLICNSETARCFRPEIPSFSLPITINNKMLVGTFYINSVC